jgi:helix-turn-helix protein
LANAQAWQHAARSIRTDTPEQKLILLLLVSHARMNGACWPSYACLLRESSLGSDHTITSALRYLRDTLKLLTWKKGWGNAHKKVPSVYQLDTDAILKSGKAEAGARDALTSPEAGALEGGRLAHGVRSKVPIEESIESKTKVSTKAFIRGEAIGVDNRDSPSPTPTSSRGEGETPVLEAGAPHAPASVSAPRAPASDFSEEFTKRLAEIV